MSAALERIEEEFRKLAPQEQVEAFERFAKTIYGEETENPELIAKLDRRLAQIEAGAVSGRDAFEVLDELSAKRSR